MGSKHDLWAEWVTANDMLMALSTPMPWALTPSLISAYATPLILLAAGLLIHWLPSMWKRRYRIMFAKAPTWLQWAICLIVGGILWERLSTGPAPFIYFQF
jgi:hypothetical protein